ncbi:hypothetical protein [Pseudomonas sp. SR18]|uniref:hypothetical protein n=1 Tax=Pseudomonas sp. SR18 TaxID=1461074 RepID=UPI002033F8A1|nr:hypothetical protein [Pseudomonas sp. SR18]MCM2362447.1 hypothetical protein [Pseudomonas sp. SR18]
MTDYIELMRLAEAAKEDPNSPYLPCPVAFMNAATPSVVLALIAENERLKKLRSTTERDLAQELEVWRNGPSCWSYGDTGDVHDIVGEWRGQCDCNVAKLIDAASELDQLKVKNETLKSDIQSWRLSIEAERNVHELSLKGVQDELDRLKGPGFAEELAALRKNAARYQWLREARSGYIEVVEWIGPHATGMIGEDLDALLDGAMGKGEKS